MPRCSTPRCNADYPPGTFKCVNPFCLCLLPEALVAGRYRIETLVGLGGMGAVYRASDTFEMQQVALKVFSITHKNVDEAVSGEQVPRDARSAPHLRPDNCVQWLHFRAD